MGYYPAREIIPGLWIGSQGDAENAAFTRDKFVVNCTKDIQAPNNYRVPVWDDPGEHDTMINHLPVVVRAMDEVLSRGKAVLVHCRAGMQRSAAVVAAYLMYKRGMTANQAMSYIQKRKSETFRPVPTFSKTLRVYERLLQKNMG